MTVNTRSARKVRIRIVHTLGLSLGLLLTFLASSPLADDPDKPKVQALEAPKAEPPEMTPEEANAEFRRVADEKTRIFLNDLSARRRVTTLFANRQSASQGIQENYVNTTSGNLTFLVRDMVRIGAMPIVFGRVYDSTLKDNDDFGPGWKLTVDEKIVAYGSGFVYTDATNATHYLHASGGKLTPKVAAWTPIRSGTVQADNGIIVLESKDLRRRFKRIDGAYRLVAVSHPLGSVDLVYDRGLLRTISSPQGSVELTRRPDGRIISARDDLGRTITYQYDDGGRLASATDLGGELWRYQYDDGGAGQQLIEIMDPRGNKMLAASYRGGRVSAMRALRNEVTFTYREGATEARDVLGRITTFHFGASGVTEGITDPAGVLTQVTFDDRFQPVAVARDGASVTHFDYDGQGRLARIDQGHGKATVLAYSGHGMVSASGGTQEARYHYKQGRLVGARDAAGDRSYGYDEKGALNAVKMDGNEIQLSIDDAGLITTVHQDDKPLMTYLHDSSGRVTSMGFGGGDRMAMVTYRYNPRGFREAANYDYGVKSRLNYDDAGNLIHYAVTDPEGRTVTQDYEIGKYNQVLRIRNGGIDVPDVSYRYDEAGRVFDMEAGGRTATVSYDNLDRAKDVTLDGATLLEYDYKNLETDAITKADALSGEVWVAAGTSAVFGTMESIVYSRPRPVEFGLVAYEPALKTLYVETSHLAPDAVLLSSLARRLVPFSPEQVDGAPFGIDKPSNSLFIPPEYRSVNCHVCSYSVRRLSIVLNGGIHMGLPAAIRVRPDGWCNSISDSYGSWWNRHESRRTTPKNFYYWINYGNNHTGFRSQPRTSGDAVFTTTYNDYRNYVISARIACSCNSTFTLRRTSRTIWVRPGCERANQDGFATRELSRFPREPFERGFEFKCQGSGSTYALTYVTNSDPTRRAVNPRITPPAPPIPAPLPSYRPPPGSSGLGFEGGYGGGWFSTIVHRRFSTPSGSEAIDPCRTELPLHQKDVAHSHPYFENTQQFNAGAGCGGVKTPRSAASLARVNQAGENFSQKDIDTAYRRRLNSSYLITSIQRDIKVIDTRRGGHWSVSLVVDR